MSFPVRQMGMFRQWMSTSVYVKIDTPDGWVSNAYGTFLVGGSVISNYWRKILDSFKNAAISLLK